MSLISRESLLRRIRRGKDSRARLVSSNLDKGIAFQIRATRASRGWTQKELAEATGMSQNNISRIEAEDYGKQTLSSLKRVADALDVALVVRLVPFSQYIDWLSGTSFIDQGISSEAMAVTAFNDENDSRLLGNQIQSIVTGTNYTMVTTPAQAKSSIPGAPGLYLVPRPISIPFEAAS